MSQRRSAADGTVTRPWSGMRREIRVVTHKYSRSDLHETMICLQVSIFSFVHLSCT